LFFQGRRINIRGEQLAADENIHFPVLRVRQNLNLGGMLLGLAHALAPTISVKATITKAAALRPDIHSSNHDLLFGIIEGHALSRLDRRNGHAQRHRVAVAGFNVGIRLLAAADALIQLRTFAEVESVRAGVGCGVYRGGLGKLLLGSRLGFISISFAYWSVNPPSAFTRCFSRSSVPPLE